MRSIIYFLLVFTLTTSTVRAAIVLDIPGPLQVFALSSKQKDPGTDHERIVFYCVAINIRGEVVYFRIFDSDHPKSNEMKIGKRFVAYTRIKIISHASGLMTFWFIPCTAGSSLSMIGKAGLEMDRFKLPKGIFPNPSENNFFANITIKSVVDLPLNPKTVDGRWLDPNQLKNVMIQGH